MSDFIEGEEKPDNRKRNVIVGGLAALAILFGCLVVVVAGVIAIDPFGWNLLDQLFGGADDAAAAMPPDTGFFVGVDLLELTPEKIGRIVDPFLAIAGEPDTPDFDSGLDLLDANMLEEFGFTFQDDILPWLGRFAGVGVSTLEFDDFGNPEEVSWSLIVSTRNEDASDSFLVKLRDYISDESGYDFDATSYEDVTIYELDTADRLERVAMTRSDGLVIFGSGALTIQASIDAEKGDSLADSDDYKVLAAELPGNRALTFYADSSIVESLQEALQQDLPLGVGPGDLPALDDASAAFSLSLADEGVQFDTVNLVDREGMSANQQELLDSIIVEPVTDHLFPDSTVVYFAGQRLDLVWASIRDSLSEFISPDEFEESMDQFTEEFGINPDTQIFSLLDGEWAVGVLPSSAGMLSKELDVDLGIAILAQTSDPDTLSGNLRILGDSLEQQFLFVEATTEGGIETYIIREDPEGPALLSFGLGQSYLFVSTDADANDRIFTDGPSLVDSDYYQEVWRAVPSQMTPAFYLNVSGLVGAIREVMTQGDFDNFDEVVQYLQPISSIAAASEAGGDVAHTTTIIFITAAD